MAERRKSSILINRKLSTDFARKLSAISVASDVSLISERFGMEQGELKNIVHDILEMNINDDFDVSIQLYRVTAKKKNVWAGFTEVLLYGIWLRIKQDFYYPYLQVGSEDGMSEYGDDDKTGGLSIWQELQNETIRLDSRKTSSSSEVNINNAFFIRNSLLCKMQNLDF